MPFTFKVDETLRARVAAELADVANGANRALAAAVNRTLTTLRSRTSTRLAKVIALPKGSAESPKPNTVSSFIGLRRAAHGDRKVAARLAGAVTITGKPLSLWLFSPSPSVPGVAQAADLAGISVKTRKGKRREVLRHTFVARMKSGKLGIFERRRHGGGGSGRYPRLPLAMRFGPTPLGVFEHAPGIAQEVLAEGDALLEKNVSSQVDRLLARRKGDRPVE